MNCKGIYYGEGIKNHAEHWFHQIRMMYAICKEFNIKYYAILRSALIFKKKFSIKDIEQLEHIYIDLNSITNSSFKESLELYSDKIKEKKYPYIYDFLNIFDDTDEVVYRGDGSHLLDEGNQIMAKRIFEIIKDDLKN